jgi:hypothetical protein
VLQNEVVKLFDNLKTLAALKRNGRKVGKLRFKGKGWFKSLTLLARAAVGLGRPELTPAEMGPLRELYEVPASSVVEAGSPPL